MRYIPPSRWKKHRENYGDWTIGYNRNVLSIFMHCTERVCEKCRRPRSNGNRAIRLCENDRHYEFDNVWCSGVAIIPVSSLRIADDDSNYVFSNSCYACSSCTSEGYEVGLSYDKIVPRIQKFIKGWKPKVMRE